MADERPQPMPGVRFVLAVASGKGGVGKSTVAANLALALGKQGKAVGLLDIDIYGPSIPIMFGLAGAKPMVNEAKKVVPLEKFGLRLMSFGFFLQSEEAVVWRGPLVARMVQQFIQDVAWGELDYLVVDLPPGTGDAQLTLSQLLPLSGVVVVSTPQDVALLDAVKGIAMFKKVKTPVSGIIENMSTFICPHCGTESQIFSHGGAEQKAQELGIPFLGEIPLDLRTRISGDSGIPIVEADPDHAVSKTFARIAERIGAELEEASRTEPIFTSSLFKSTLPRG